MAKYLITGADGQLGQCFQAIAHEFSSDELIFVNQDKVDITSTKSLKKFYYNALFCIKHRTKCIISSINFNHRMTLLYGLLECGFKINTIRYVRSIYA